MGHIPIFPSQRQLGVLHNYLFFIKFNDLGIVIHILQFHILDNNTFFFCYLLGMFLNLPAQIPWNICAYMYWKLYNQSKFLMNYDAFWDYLAPVLTYVWLLLSVTGLQLPSGGTSSYLLGMRACVYSKFRTH